MKLLNCYIFYLRILVRTWIIPILLLGTISYGAFTFFLYRSSNDQQIVLTGNPLILSLMLSYLFMGIYLTKIDEKEEIYETFSVIENASLYKNMAKWLISLSSLLFINIIFYLIYIFFFYTKDFNNKTYFLSVFKYIELYWCLPGLIMFVLGNLLGTWIKGKIIYFIALALYVITIPINYTVFGTESNISSFRIDRLLNLGEPNITRNYNSLYGFSLNSIHWNKKVFIITMLISLLLLTWRARKVISTFQLKLSLTPMLVILVGTFIYGLQPHQVLSDKEATTNLYYQEHKSSMDDKFKAPVRFKKYDIKLDTRANLKALVKIDTVSTSSQNLKQIKLGLFHELTVHQVKLDGKEIAFKQNNDLLTLYFKNSPWKPDTKRTLEFEYSGLQSDLYLANSQAVYLPNYAPWLPSESTLPSFDIVSRSHLIHRIPHQPSDKREYYLTVKGANHLYTNLNNTGRNTWEGTSTDGLSLISGQLSSKKQQNITYVYPNTWESQFTHTNSIYDYLKNVTDVMKSTLNDDSISLPSTIYFIPNQNITDGLPGEGTWWNKDYLIWGFNHIDYPREPFFMDDSLANVTPQLVLAKTKLSSHKEDYKFNILFSNVYAQALNNELKLPNDSMAKDFDDLFNHNFNMSEIEAKVKAQLVVWLKSENALNPNNPVYKKWYSLIQHPTSQKWNTLYNILEKENLK